MRTRTEYVNLISTNTDTIKSQFGVKSLRLFGSVARGDNGKGSDVDVCVEMAPKLYLIVSLKRFLESLLGCPVDVIREHKNMNSSLKREIERDGIYVIR